MNTDNSQYNIVWNIPNNKSFESPQQVKNLLYEYSVPCNMVESEFPNHTGVAVPNHLVERAAHAIEYAFGRRL